MSAILDRKLHAAASIVTAIAGLVLTLGVAQAQLTDAQKSAMRANCRSDFMANCMSTSPGSKEALECLQNNLAKLSPGCQAAVKATMPPPPAAAAPPPPPAPPPAAAAPPPPPPAPSPAAAAPPPPPPAAVAAPPPPKAATPKRAKTAMPKPVHAPKPAAVPPPAPAVMAPPPEPEFPLDKVEKLSLVKRLAIMRACGYDKDAVCPSVKSGGSRIVVCLASHPKALSPYCRRALAKAIQ